jgi:hypothetical protein
MVSATVYATDLKDKIEEAGAACVDKAQEVTSSVMNAASAMAHTVGDAGTTVGAKANDATAAVGGGMQSLAGTIRESMPRDGALGTASTSVAASLENGGKYLQQEGINGMAKDVTDLIRRNPVPALLVGVGVGFLLAKLTVWGVSHAK